jgi:hypothetical protein
MNARANFSKRNRQISHLHDLKSFFLDRFLVPLPNDGLQLHPQGHLPETFFFESYTTQTTLLFLYLNKLPLRFSAFFALQFRKKELERVLQQKHEDPLLIVLPRLTEDVGRIPAPGESGPRVSFLDLNGNYLLLHPNLREPKQHLEEVNRYRNYPFNLYTSENTRLAHLLLLHPNRYWKQEALCKAAQLSAGHVSDYCNSLLHQDLMIRDTKQGWKLIDPEAFLEGWANIAQTSPAPNSLTFTSQAISIEHTINNLSEAIPGKYLIGGHYASQVYQSESPTLSVPLTLYWAHPALQIPLRKVNIYRQENPSKANIQVLLREDPYSCWLGSTECGSFKITSKVQTYLDLIQSDGMHSLAASSMKEMILAPFELVSLSVAA